MPYTDGVSGTSKHRDEKTFDPHKHYGCSCCGKWPCVKYQAPNEEKLKELCPTFIEDTQDPQGAAVLAIRGAEKPDPYLPTGIVCRKCFRSKCVCERSAARDLPEGDEVSRPPHYTRFTIEPIAAIESWGLNWHLGNVVKYVARCDHKGSALVDLKKAHWLLAREIGRREKAS